MLLLLPLLFAATAQVHDDDDDDDEDNEVFRTINGCSCNTSTTKMGRWRTHHQEWRSHFPSSHRPAWTEITNTRTTTRLVPVSSPQRSSSQLWLFQDAEVSLEVREFALADRRLRSGDGQNWLVTAKNCRSEEFRVSVTRESLDNERMITEPLDGGPPNLCPGDQGELERHVFDLLKGLYWMKKDEEGEIMLEFLFCISLSRELDPDARRTDCIRSEWLTIDQCEAYSDRCSGRRWSRSNASNAPSTNSRAGRTVYLHRCTGEWRQSLDNISPRESDSGSHSIRPCLPVLPYPRELEDHRQVRRLRQVRGGGRPDNGLG